MRALIKRLKNLWALSAFEPMEVKGIPMVKSNIMMPKKGVIIDGSNPVDEVYEAIRKENPSETGADRWSDPDRGN
jgi:hypothetical protein